MFLTFLNFYLNFFYIYGLGQILHDQLHWLDVPDRGSLQASSDSLRTIFVKDDKSHCDAA